MLFTQRLFTLLLGLLFVVVLTDQASALYDPGVGRFCSRDPLGHVDGNNQYQFVGSEPVDRIDPEGTITIDSVGYNLKRLDQCYGEAYIKWNFVLSRKAKDLCNGSHGWIVQKVTVSCSGEPCSDCKRCDEKAGKDSNSYFEAWYVGPNEDTPSRHHQPGIHPQYTDQSSIPKVAGTCGHVKASGEVRFYCGFKPTTSAGIVSFELCGRTVTSGTLPGVMGSKTPEWWMNRKSDDGVAKREHTRDWRCCRHYDGSDEEDESEAEPM